MIFNFSTCSLNFYILMTELLPLCGQCSKLICSIVLMIQRRKHIHQIKMKHSIELQYGRGHGKVKLPDDISFHGSLFHSFHSVPELIFAF